MVSSANSWSPTRAKLSAGLAVILVIVVAGHLQRSFHDYRALAHAGATEQSSDVPSDFPPYHVAALIARQHGDHRLYYPPEKTFSTLLAPVAKNTSWSSTAHADGFEKGTMAFIYPPFAALVLEPLSLEPWPAALFLWRITLTAMVFLSVYLCLLLIECNNRFTHFVVVTAAVVWFFPFTETIFQGQIDPVILLCWAGGAYLIKRDRPVWSALLFAMGTLVKASPIIVVGLFLMRRQWKWLISYTLWCGLLLGISIWRLGWENHVIWASKVLPALSQGVPYFANKSVSALIYELYLRRVPVDFDFSIPHFLPRIIGVFNFLIYCAALLYLWTKNRKANAMTYELIVMALLAVVISPVSWRHHYLLALLPVTYLWYELKDDWRDWSLLATVTLAMGTVFIDYAIVVIRKPIVDLPLASVLPISTLLLLILALANYAPITVRERNEQRPTNLLRAA